MNESVASIRVATFRLHMLAVFICAIATVEAYGMNGGLEKMGNQVVVTSWLELGEALETDVADGGLDAITLSPIFADLEATGNSLLWSAMLEQGEQPFVQLAGFYLFKRNHPRAVAHAALAAIAAAENPAGLLYGPIYAELQEWDAPNEDPGVFLSYARSGVEDPKASLIATILPLNALKEWVAIDLDELQHPVNVTLYALAVDRLVAEDGGQEWADRLPKLRAIPGVPRHVYLLHVPESQDGDVVLLLDSLRSPELHLVHFTILARRYKNIIDLDRLEEDVSEERRSIIRRLQEQ